MLIDPPFLRNRQTKAWLESIWGVGFVKWKRRNPSWFGRKAGAYVGSYAKKMGDKTYQQNYETVPREVRTFVNNRREHTPAELHQHADSWDAAYVHRMWNPDTQAIEPEHLELATRIRHVGRPCSLPHVTKRMSLEKRKRLSLPQPPMSVLIQQFAAVNRGLGQFGVGVGHARAPSQLDITYERKQGLE